MTLTDTVKWQRCFLSPRLLQSFLQLGHRRGPAPVRQPDAAADLRRPNPGCGHTVEDRALWRRGEWREAAMKIDRSREKERWGAEEAELWFFFFKVDRLRFRDAAWEIRGGSGEEDGEELKIGRGRRESGGFVSDWVQGWGLCKCNLTVSSSGGSQQ